MNPSTPKTEPLPSTQLRTAVFGGSRSFQAARLPLVALVLLVAIPGLCGEIQAHDRVTFTVAAAANGNQLVRTSLPLPRGFLGTNQALVVKPAGRIAERVGLRVLSWHPSTGTEPRTARRALVTFPYFFANTNPVAFELETARPKKDKPVDFPVTLQADGELFKLAWKDGRKVDLHLIAPPRTSSEPFRLEIVEENRFFRWQRLHFADPQWPRVIEFRFDAAGSVVAVAHLQRRSTNDNFAPELGWELATSVKGVSLRSGETLRAATNKPLRHSFAEGADATYLLVDQSSIYHPTAPLKRRGGVEIVPDEKGFWTYRYLRCRAEDKVPMQPMSWQRAEIVIAPPTLAKLTSSLASPHRVEPERKLWSALYRNLEPLPSLPPVLDALVLYHRDAIVRSAAVGDDFGNVTRYRDGSAHGDGLGSHHRLNHGVAIFEGGWRGNDRRLTETALLWCDNFFDQSIWWGEPQRGGTRYPSVAKHRAPTPTKAYMWRSDSSVNFCTKGYDCFWLAWEETGDPRMWDALRAQTAYAAQFVHSDQGQTRNIGVVSDFIHKAGLKVGYAKPYIIGYALAGLPELIQFAPNEPDLKETVRAVADFLAATVDPAGGWHYPHPCSSGVVVRHGLEQAWHLTQAARALGPEPKWLDAIETVLRARVLGWQRTGKILSELEGWETSTGKVKDRKELYKLYKKPADRDPTRDYREGNVSYGSAAPEGIVYFEDVLGYYLQHRPAARLLAEPKPDDPLGLILARSPEKKE